MRLFIPLLILISSLSFVGCANKGSEVENSFNSVIELPKVVDTISVKGSFYVVDSMQSARYPVEGVGCLDSSEVDINKVWWNSGDDQYYPSEKDIQESQNIQLVIDTSQFIIKKITKFKVVAEGESNKDVYYYKAFPLFIINKGDSISFIDLQDASFTIIQEAKDKRCIWQPIEYWTFSWCGNSYGYLTLQPKHFGVTKIPIYKGDFKTELRVKLYSNKKIYYSNSYWGSVNLSQLVPIIDERKSRSSFLNVRD